MVLILVLSRWVRVGCARLLCGHEVPPRGPDPGSARTLARVNCYVLACEVRKVGGFRRVVTFGATSEAASWHGPSRTEFDLIPRTGLGSFDLRYELFADDIVEALDLLVEANPETRL